MAYPPAPAPPGTTIGAPAMPGAAPAAFAPPAAAYTTPSGIPALPRPQLQMSSAEVKEWFGRISKDRARRELEIPKWRQLLKAYFPPNYGADYTDLNSNIHFRNVHLKLSELWAQFPDLILTPRDPLRQIPQLGPDGQPMLGQNGQPQLASPDDIVAIRREILNYELGIDGANVDLTVQQSLFDVFMTSGIGPSKICYESDVAYVEPTPPTPQPGAILGLSGAGQPQPQQPVVVNERRRWYHFSAEQLIIPVGFLSTDWDRAPYLGMEFEEPDTPNARKAYNLPPTWSSTTSKTDRALTADSDRAAQNGQKVIKGVEIWLHAADFDPAEVNRDVFYRLVLIDGLQDRAAIYELSPYQDKDEQGHLTTDSMIGNPIHPICLRVASDTAWVPSDAAFTNPLVNIENLQEKQDALIREANVPRFLHATSLTQAIDKMREAGTGQGAAVDDAVMARGVNNLLFPLPHLERAQSDIQGREHNRQSITETLGLGANQSGAYNQTRHSATESAIVAQSVSARLQGERQMLLARVMQGVAKFAALQTRYMTDAGYVQVAGEDGLRKLTAFNHAHLAPRFAFTAHPDSQLLIDQTTRIKRATDFINFVAKSPAVDQTGLARLATREFGYNAAELIRPPTPPPPDKPAASLAIKVEDLAVPEMRALIAAMFPQLAPVLTGPISPEAVAAAHAASTPPPQPHGGGMPTADTVNKHKAAETGAQPGVHPIAPVVPPPASPLLPHPATH